MENPTKTDASFTESLYRQANAYFSTQACGQYATGAFFAKAWIILLIFLLTYAWFLSDAETAGRLFTAAVLLGVCHVLIPVNISHDAIHDAVSSKRWINALCLYGLEITGTNSYMYSRKHLEAHSNKENASKVTAIETQRLLLQRDTKEGRINLHPAYYLFFAQYMIFIRDFQMYFFSRASVPFSEYVKLFLWKTLYICLFVIAPLILIDLPLWLIAIALCLMYFVVTVISVFILLMPTEEMEHARYDGNNNIDDAWAAEVMRHNVDFSPDNRLVNALAGGANLNVIHYLFPSACHVHYSDLASLVETVSQKYGIYYRRQSVTDVVRIHIKYLTQIQRSSA